MKKTNRYKTNTQQNNKNLPKKKQEEKGTKTTKY